MNQAIKKVIRKSTILSSFRHKIKKVLGKEDFLNEINGVIHIGANTGQEREIYKNYNLSVVWIEPQTFIFEELKRNITNIDKQKAYQYLITDIDDKEYDFFIANNKGESSSIFELEKHQDIWPEVMMTDKLKIKSKTLLSFMEIENIDIEKYDGLIMDVQGAELLILKGASNILRKFKYIMLEVADFESYKGCCKVDEIEAYLLNFGFKEFHRSLFASRKEGGNYYDIVYKRR